MGMLADNTVESFLDKLADRTPTPGGGAVAALAGALACAQARMVAAYSIRKDIDERQRNRVSELMRQLHRADRMLRDFADEDAAAYENLSEVMKRKDVPQAEQDMALEIALMIPLEIAATACSALTTMKALQNDASRYLLSDLGVAAVVSESAVQAAGFSVRINVAELKSENRKQTLLSQVTTMETHAMATRKAIEGGLPDYLSC